MPNHPRVETADYTNFVTTRTRNSELWFVNNQKLEHEVLGSFAKCLDRYKADVFAISLEGSHIHHESNFPKLNRADFMRDFNSAVTRAVKRHVPKYPGGGLWQRRYSNEFLLTESSVVQKFLYTVLQPVQDGLVEHLEDYPGYNCLHDAAWGIERKFKVVRWAEYNAARRWNKELKIEDFTDTVKLRFTRLPGFEHLSQEDYAKTVFAMVEQERQRIVAARKAAGKGFMGRKGLLAVIPGTPAKSPKLSSFWDIRPRVISGSARRNKEGYAWYFDLYHRFKAASAQYRAGDLTVEFPPGMYRPYLRTSIGCVTSS
jgi:REP element-mobilizing transposase RayT